MFITEDSCKVVGLFEKVSFEQYYKDMISQGFIKADDEEQRNICYKFWCGIQIPTRATRNSAGYDFYLPFNVCLNEDQPVVVPTGIRVNINSGWFLMLVPRSGLGFKFGMRLSNTAGIIDSDYYFATNEGHIMAKILASKAVSLKEQDRFMQGIFLQHGIAENEESFTSESRTGGFGSTGR